VSWEQPVAAAIAMAAIVRIVTLFIIVVNYTRSVLCTFWAEVYIVPQKYAKKDDRISERTLGYVKRGG